MKNMSCGSCHSIVPVLLILIAVVFLLQALGYLAPSVVSILWPVLLGIAGIAKLSDQK